MMIKLGVGSWTLPWAMGFKKNTWNYPRMSVLQLLNFAQEQDVRLVQLYNNVNLLSCSTVELQRIKVQADAYGIELAIGAEGIDQYCLVDYLKIAKELGSKSLRMVIPPAEKGGTARISVGEVSRQILEYVDQLETASVILLIENHDRYSSCEYREIIEQIGSPLVGICFDSANSTGRLEHFTQSFAILKNYIFNCHFKEYCVERIPTNLGFIIEGCCPGKGENIAPVFFDLIKGLDRNIDVTLEQWVPFQGTIEDTLRVEKEWAYEGIKLLKNHTSNIDV